METQNNIADLIRKNESRYVASSGTTISKYVRFDMYDTLNRIDAYINSMHTSGDLDALGRDKPFFNICTSARNIWYRATDIDRKDIKMRAKSSADIMEVMLLTIFLQNWMDENNFGAFLNEWGRVLATYGSAVSKWVEKGGELIPSVVPWNRLIVDSVEFDNDVVIELLELTPSQLAKNKSYDQTKVDNLLDSLETRKGFEKAQKDTKVDFVRLYETHGDIALSYLTGKENDDDTFTQQMHVISYVEGTEAGKFDDYTLVSGKEKKNPYHIAHLIKEDGRTLSIGAVENLFQAQWMQNHSMKAIKDQLDLASKLIFQTADGNFVGQNAIDAIETGDILIHDVNMPLTQLQNNSHDIVSFQNFASQWKALGNEINGISESMMGVQPPSGTAWRQTEALLQESHSLFELMTENKGLAIEDMIRTYVLPYLKTKMDTSKEISAALSAIDIQKIDKKYVPYEATKRLAKQVIHHIITKGVIPDVSPNAMQDATNHVKSELDAQGNQRYFVPDELTDKTWKEVFKDIDSDVQVEVGAENKDTQAAMTTINSALQLVLSKQGQPFTPTESFLFNKMLTLSGEVSPMELSQITESSATPTPPPAQNPAQAPVPSPIQQPQLATQGSSSGN